MWIVALLAIFASTALHAGCFEKRTFDQIIKQVTPAFEDIRALTPIEQLGLNGALRQLNPSGITYLAEQSDLSIYSGFLAGMLDELVTLQRTGSVQSSNLSAMDLQLAAQIFDRLCFAEEETQDTEEPQTLTHKFGLFTFTFEQILNIGNAPDIRSYFNLSLVFFLLLGLISMIVLVWKIYAISIRLLSRQKACAIPARLQSDEAEVLGTVVFLGTHRLKFVTQRGAQNMSVFLDKLESHASNQRCIIIGDRKFAIELIDVSEMETTAQFVQALEHRTLKTLFKLSIHSSSLTGTAEKPLARSKLAQSNG